MIINFCPRESKLSSFHLEFSFNSIHYICLLFYCLVTFGFLWHKFCFKKIHWSDNSLLQIKSSNEKNLWFIPHFDYCEKCFTLKHFFKHLAEMFFRLWRTFNYGFWDFEWWETILYEITQELSDKLYAISLTLRLVPGRRERQ